MACTDMETAGKLSVRIRIVHARVRNLLSNSEDDWDTEAWGLPISAAHLGYAVSAFSARLLKHMKTLGAKYDDEEYASFMAVWRYSGYLMGIPETILFHEADDALELYDIGHMCEPDCPMESVVMATLLDQFGSVDCRDKQTRKAARSWLAMCTAFPAVSSEMRQRMHCSIRRFPHLELSGGSRCSSVMATSLASCCRVVATTAITPNSHPCWTPRYSTKRASATRCPTTCMRRSRGSGEVGG